MKLVALLVNCTLKPSPDPSNTGALLKIAQDELKSLGVETEQLRLVDYNIEPGTNSKMSDQDEWPVVLDKIKKCDILIIGSPIWVGRTCSIAQRLIERMDAVFYEKDLHDPSTGQYFTYNKVAGALVTGNEDGAHSVIAHLLWSMSEFGFTIPPNVNAYWVGKAGPGPSYIEDNGPKYLYTNKGALTMIHNLVYFATLLKKHPIDTNTNKLNKKAGQISED